MNRMLGIVGLLMASMCVCTAEAGRVLKLGGEGTTQNAIAVTHKFSPELAGGKHMSVGIWVKGPLRAQYRNILIGCRNAWSLQIAYSGDVNNRKLTFYMNTETLKVGGGKISYDTIADGNWHFAAATLDLEVGEAKVYFDGQLVDTKTTTDESIAVWNEYLSIGGNDVENGSSHYFNNQAYEGSFAEASLWSKTLTAAEIADYYTHRIGGDEEGLLVYLPLCQESGDAKGFKSGDKNGAYAANQKQGTVSWIEDPTFPLPAARYLVTPEYAKQEGLSVGKDCRTWAHAGTNLQEVLDVVLPSETIYVRSGRYRFTEEASVTNRAVTIRSYDPVTGGRDRDGTVFDGQGLTRIFYSHHGVEAPMSPGSEYRIPTEDRPVVIDGITFTNGLAATASRNGHGGAVQMYGLAKTVTSCGMSKLLNCRFVGNEAKGGGGAVALWGGMISNCVFESNVAASHGGGYYGITSSTGYNRRRLTEPSDGWGHCASIFDTVFTNNQSTAGGGGGSYCSSNCGQTMFVVGCDYLFNTCGGSDCKGGGHSGQFSGCVRNCTFVGNAGATYGGALYAQEGTLVSNCVIRANSDGNFGALWVECRADVRECEIVGNASWGVYGKSVLLRNCLVARNGTVRTSDGGVNTMIEKAEMVNCTVVDNSGYGLNQSHGVSNYVKTNVVVNCIFAGNNGGAGNAQFNAPDACGWVDFTATCSSSAFPPSGDRCSIDSASFTGNPRFVDAVADDWSLCAGSRCRDRGVREDWMIGAVDLAGNPRLADARGKPDAGANPDLGCFECLLAKPGLMLILR